ncbi:hypothetical protein FOA52_007546 [Chlamydomonas sp. UWO 241]|nr:hypothetical protein FOA52_007546 [Chlamydomonas sp. UWO 241]
MVWYASNVKYTLASAGGLLGTSSSCETYAATWRTSHSAYLVCAPSSCETTTLCCTSNLCNPWILSASSVAPVLQLVSLAVISSLLLIMMSV